MSATNKQFIETKVLSQPIRDALASVGYGGRDVEVVASSTVSLHSGAAWKGARGFILAVDLRTGARTGQTGSWGGANPWEHRAVDTTDEVYTLPPFGAVITGQTGYPRTFARVYVHPSQLAQFLPAVAEELSETERQALYCFVCVKGGAYRRDELARRRVSAEVVASLVERGFLVRNKAGAVQVTTKGKNAPRVRF